MAARIEDLEGWLFKTKRTENQAGLTQSLLNRFTGTENKRWFRVMSLPRHTIRKGGANEELALCYFHGKHQRNEEAKGLIFLNDVVAITEEDKTFTLETSTQRLMTLQSSTKNEHRHWLRGLAERCPNANLGMLTTSNT